MRRREDEPEKPAPPISELRAKGMTQLLAECQNCRREVPLPIEAVPHHLTLPALGPRAVCTKCGLKGNVVRADWSSVPGYKHSVFQYRAP